MQVWHSTLIVLSVWICAQGVCLTSSVSLSVPSTVLGPLQMHSKLAVKTLYVLNKTLLLSTNDNEALSWGKLPHGFNPKKTVVLITKLLKARMFSGLIWTIILIVTSQLKTSPYACKTLKAESSQTRQDLIFSKARSPRVFWRGINYAIMHVLLGFQILS